MGRGFRGGVLIEIYKPSIPPIKPSVTDLMTNYFKASVQAQRVIMPLNAMRV